MRVVSALLSGVSAGDPLTYAGVAIALTLVASSRATCRPAPQRASIPWSRSRRSRSLAFLPLTQLLIAEYF
jgi:hypothetical protein